jgi:hypothetical protein
VTGLVLAAAYYAIAGDVPESPLADAVGPVGLPRIYAIVLAGLSLILIGQSLRGGRETDHAPSVRRAFGLLVLGTIYIAVVPIAGYVVSIAALIAATTWYQGRLFNVRILLVAIVGAALFWLLFVVLLGVPHPPGLWSS